MNKNDYLKYGIFLCILSWCAWVLLKSIQLDAAAWGLWALGISVAIQFYFQSENKSCTVSSEKKTEELKR